VRCGLWRDACANASSAAALRRSSSLCLAHTAPESSAEELLSATKQIRLDNLKTIADAGVDVIPSNDFTLYDGTHDVTCWLNALPEKYKSSGLSALDTMFAAARGHQRDGVDLPALEMKKWFDSNYHYLVNELGPSSTFSLVADAEVRSLSAPLR